MSITQSGNACAAILVALKDISANDPTISRTPLALQALLDPTNTAGVTVQQTQFGESGHRKPLRIAFKQRKLVSEVRDSISCDGGTDVGYLEEDFDVTLQSQLPFRFSESRMRILCEAFSTWSAVPVQNRDKDQKAQSSLLLMKEMTDEIVQNFDVIRQAMNAKFLDAYALLEGGWQGGGSKSYDMLKAADSSIVVKGFNIFRQDLAKMGLAGQPILFGGGNLDLAMMSLDFGCCNLQGQDLGQMASKADMKFYRDYSDMAAALGNANAFGAFYPKTVQYVQYKKYVGDFAGPIGNSVRGFLPDPQVPGLGYDFKMTPNECGEFYDIWLSADYGFYGAPVNAFAIGDRMQGVNGVLQATANAI